jgi:hypothetical protein
MPIHTCCSVLGVYDAIWTYIPNEEIDFSKFSFIRTLLIECYGPNDMTPPTERTPWCYLKSTYPLSGCNGYMNLFTCNRPRQNTDKYILPSLRRFPFLTKIIIQNTYGDIDCPVHLDALTDLPTDLRVLELINTKITDIGQLIATCPTLATVRLHRNYYAITLLQIPPNLTKLDVYSETLTTEIHLPPSVILMSFVKTVLPRLHVHQSMTNSVFGRHDRFIISQCKSPYDESVMSCKKIPFAHKIKEVFRTNSVDMYCHFASIPDIIRRTNNIELNNTNVFVKVFTLASNYPRRMAEFMDNPLV